MMSSLGSAFRSLMIGTRYSSSDRIAASAVSRSSGLSVGSRMRARWSDHTANCARSSGGMPSISAMTITGNGLATASMRSKAAGSSTASRSVVMSSRMWGSRAATARGVKALLTRARSRVWSGGSRNSMLGSSTLGRLARRPDATRLRGSLEKWRWSRRMASASEKRENTHASMSRLRCTGSRPRSFA